MLSSNENQQRFPDCVRCGIYDTDQTDFAEPVGRSVWNGVIATIVLIALGIGMMGMLISNKGAKNEDRRHEKLLRSSVGIFEAPVLRQPLMVVGFRSLWRPIRPI